MFGRLLPALFLVLALAPAVRAQTFLLPNNFTQAVLPFEYANGFLLVTLTVNNQLPLRFVFDTGAEHTLLLQPEMAVAMKMRYTRVFDIQGADMLADRKAYLVRNVTLSAATARNERLDFTRRSILVLQEDYFRFDAYAGVPVHGILGADIFANFTVRIDFRHRRIELSRPGRWKPRKSFATLPVELYRNKAYLRTHTSLVAGDSIPVKLLVDTGAALPLLLYTETSPQLTLPETVIEGQIGTGLGGNLSGFMGRMHGLWLGPYRVDRPVTHFQRLPVLVDTSRLNQRQGILGSRLLERYEVVLDYTAERIYLRRYRRRPPRPRYDRSGLVLTAGGPGLNEFYAHWVVPGSPAAEAGLLPGDRILRANGQSARLLGLNGLRRLLQRRAGKRIRLRWLRDEHVQNSALVLRDLL